MSSPESPQPQPADPTRLVISCAGWALLRLPTDPDPSDEPRGVSGYTFAFAGEPDLDRILYLQPPANFAPRSQSPPLGVRVTSAVRTDGEQVPVLASAAVNLSSHCSRDSRDSRIQKPSSLATTS